MVVSGLCHICGRPSASLYSCRMCGALVCEQHYDPKTGLCSNCAARHGGKSF